MAEPNDPPRPVTTLTGNPKSSTFDRPVGTVLRDMTWGDVVKIAGIVIAGLSATLSLGFAARDYLARGELATKDRQLEELRANHKLEASELEARIKLLELQNTLASSIHATMNGNTTSLVALEGDQNRLRSIFQRLQDNIDALTRQGRGMIQQSDAIISASPSTSGDTATGQAQTDPDAHAQTEDITRDQEILDEAISQALDAFRLAEETCREFFQLMESLSGPDGNTNYMGWDLGAQSQWNNPLNQATEAIDSLIRTLTDIKGSHTAIAPPIDEAVRRLRVYQDNLKTLLSIQGRPQDGAATAVMVFPGTKDFNGWSGRHNPGTSFHRMVQFSYSPQTTTNDGPLPGDEVLLAYKNRKR